MAPRADGLAKPSSAGGGPWPAPRRPAGTEPSRGKAGAQQQPISTAPSLNERFAAISQSDLVEQNWTVLHEQVKGRKARRNQPRKLKDTVTRDTQPSASGLTKNKS
jgi:hypothetical protein